ncbi:MAG TPA: cyclase family protein [Candidatus Limnocylindria bacterium]|nr:cyclase family protein [Candidatus Limnocylindria bacterium]
MKVHDVTLAVRAGMVTWKGGPGPAVEPTRRISKGDAANESRISLGDHTGTHVDPPVHFIEGGATAERLPLEALVGPCRVVEHTGDGHVTAAVLDQAARGAERILLRTANSERWRRGEPFTLDFVALDESGAAWCVGNGVRLVGIDYLSIEPQGPRAKEHPVHTALLSEGVVIVEGLDLSGVRAGDYELFCGPLRIEGGTGAPARVLLVER